jgi:hypothetical protein
MAPIFDVQSEKNQVIVHVPGSHFVSFRFLSTHVAAKAGVWL